MSKDGKTEKNTKSKLNLKKASEKPEALNKAGAGREACQQCGLFRKCKSPFLYPFVPVGWTGKLLLVGEAPGQDEDEKSGRPFTGPAGKLLRKIYRKAGWKDEDVVLVNAVRCRPPKNATPDMKVIRCCRPFLLKVIQTLKPRYVVGLGATAMRALRNDGSVNVTRQRGKEIEITFEKAS